MIQFLPKYVVASAAPDQFYQAAFIGEYNGEAACQFCYYLPDRQPVGDKTFAQCSMAHKCDDGNQPYIRVEPLHLDEIQEAEIPDAPGQAAYQDTTFLRQQKVKSMPRYCQLVTSQLTGYVCNSLCAFFNERIEKKQSARACGKVKACANNSSFYDLLVPASPTLRAIYDRQMLDETSTITSKT